MIGKAKSNKSLQATIAYNEKEKATLIYANNLVGISLADYRMQMEDLQKCYRGYARQLTIHAILSPSIEDGKRLNASQWKIMADKYIANMKMQGLQAIGFLHEDKEHKHLHLVINKVKEDDFKLFHDNFIGKKTQKAADNIAIDMKLIRAAEIRQSRINQSARIKDALQAGINISEEKPAGTKQQFKSILEGVIKNSYSSIDEYFTALNNAGFKVHSYANEETGGLRGYGVEMNGVKMDASAIGKKFTLNALKIDEEKSHQINIDNSQRETINAGGEITILKDKAKIRSLESYAKAMGISKEVLKNDSATQMVEHNKKYFLAMKNDSGGYVMNNIFSTAQCGENDITTIFINKEYPTLIVEDMFAYLLHKQQHQKFNYIILNSMANKDKLVKKLAEMRARNVIIQLKDDSIGRSVTQEILNVLNNIWNKNQPNPINKRETKQIPNPLKSINEKADNADKNNRRQRGISR
jgi:hypothetical protein